MQQEEQRLEDSALVRKTEAETEIETGTETSEKPKHPKQPAQQDSTKKQKLSESEKKKYF